jgi:hypothetical protein
MEKPMSWGRILVLTVLLTTLSQSTFAEPLVSSVAGTVSHKATLTVTGSGFGSKSPAAPRIWDWCDDSSPDSLDTFYPGDRYPRACASPSETPYEIAYRTSFHSFSTMPHARITKFISSATVTCNGSWTSEQADNVITTDTWGADTLFLMYYYRMSPTWGKETNASSGDNLKEVSANGCDGNLCGTYLNGGDTYIDWCNGQTPMIMNGANALMRGGSSSGAESCASGNCVSVANPMAGWIHSEIYWDNTNGYKYGYSNGTSTAIAANWARRFLNAASGTNARTISIGGFTRWPRENTTGNYRYWAGIYADSTYARVMVGNNPTWGNCTIREPQIPSQWSGTSITCTVNQGQFGEGRAYLFVFNASNEHNGTGYPISFGSGQDTQAPAAPTGLEVVIEGN